MQDETLKKLFSGKKEASARASQDMRKIIENSRSLEEIKSNIECRWIWYNYRVNEFLSATLIKKFCSYRNYELAKEVYTHALRTGVVNTVVLNAIITQAGRNRDLAFAKAVFESAERNDIQLNVISYNSMINAAGQNGDLAFAKAV